MPADQAGNPVSSPLTYEDGQTVSGPVVNGAVTIYGGANRASVSSSRILIEDKI